MSAGAEQLYSSGLLARHLQRDIMYKCCMILKMRYTIQIYLAFLAYGMWTINNISLSEALRVSFDMPLEAIQAAKKRCFLMIPQAPFT